MTDFLSMSDEDFDKLGAPPVTEEVSSAPVVEKEPVVEPVLEPVVETPPVTADQQLTDQVAAEASEPVTEVPPVTEPKLDEQGNPVVEPVVEAAPAVEFDYKSEYESLIKPIKANGKEIELKTPAELRQLAQMGANYTRKMQDIAPHRKTLLMLENNGLLDEKKLSFLIDLSNKDPSAIQKFLKESEINPLDIDVEAEPTYKGGNHRVTDEEALFRSAVDDAAASDVGKVVIQAIDQTWDQASKEILYSQPNILETMVQQQEAGFYERIAGEVDRRRVLGQIPAGTPFLHAYKLVGDQMVAAGQLQDLVAKQEVPPQTPPEPVAVRVAPVKPAVVNNDRANAAAPSQAAPNAAKKLVNPLSMDDDEFIKHFQKRL